MFAVCGQALNTASECGPTSGTRGPLQCGSHRQSVWCRSAGRQGARAADKRSLPEQNPSVNVRVMESTIFGGCQGQPLVLENERGAKLCMNVGGEGLVGHVGVPRFAQSGYFASASVGFRRPARSMNIAPITPTKPASHCTGNSRSLNKNAEPIAVMTGCN